MINRIIKRIAHQVSQGITLIDIRIVNNRLDMVEWSHVNGVKGKMSRHPTDHHSRLLNVIGGGYDTLLINTSSSNIKDQNHLKRYYLGIGSETIALIQHVENSVMDKEFYSLVLRDICEDSDGYQINFTLTVNGCEIVPIGFVVSKGKVRKLIFEGNTVIDDLVDLDEVFIREIREKCSDEDFNVFYKLSDALVEFINEKATVLL